MVKIALINASPRNENTSDIVEHIVTNFKKMANFEIINLRDIKIEFCISCGWCKNGKGHCVKDDDVDAALKKIVDSDAVIFISPVYMGNMTGQLKAFIDRSVCLRRAGFMLKDKVASSISIGATRNGGQELVIQQINAALYIHGMIIVGDDNHFGGTVHVPFEKDEFGKKTIEDTVKKVIDITQKIHK